MEKIAFILYLCGIVFGVLFFGAIHTWVYTIVFLTVIIASLLMLKGALVKGYPSPSPQRHAGHFLADEEQGRNGGGVYLFLRWIKTDLGPLFFLFFILLILQMIPLPHGLVVMISPDAKIAGDMSQPAAVLDRAESVVNWYALAPYLHPVRMSLIRWVLYGFLFFGLIRCLNSRKRIETAIVAILALCCLDALYGIMQTYSGSQRAWWFKVTTYGRDVSGTYLSRNHFAGLMEMGITLAIAYAGALGGKGEETHGPSRFKLSFKQRFLRFFSERRKESRQFLVIFAGGVMGLGLILSASRGGIMATAGALLLMGLCFYFRKSERRKGKIILFLFGIALLFGLHAGLDYTIGRFEFFDRDMKDRNVMSGKALDLFKDYFIAGVGMGNFRHAYGKYQDPLHKDLYVDYAHNDYAQFLADTGIVGALFLLVGMGWYAIRSFQYWRRRRDPFAVCLGIAPFGALFALAIHSWSDYNLHRPANVMVLIAVIAIGYAALHLEHRRHHDRVIWRQRIIPLRPWGVILLTCTAGLILWCGVWTLRHFIAETYCNTGINITMYMKDSPSADEARKAIAWNPGNAVYPFKLAQALMIERDKRVQSPMPDMDGWKRSYEPIIGALEQAIRLNPMNAEYHVRLAWEYSYLFDRPDYLNRRLPAADICLDRAAWFAGNWAQNPRLQYDMGNYWTMRVKTFGPNDSKRKIAWTRALWHYRVGMVLEKIKEPPKDIQNTIRNFLNDKAPLQELIGK